MGADRAIIDSAGNEAKATTSGNRLQVEATVASTADLDILETTLDAIETLLQGTAKVKIWDGTHTLDIDANSKMPISSTQLTTIDGVLDAIQALLEGTQLSKIWDGTHTLDIAADSTLPVSGTVTIQEPLSVDDNAGSLTVDQATPANLKTQIYGLEGANVRAVAVDANGKLSVTF